MIAKGSSSCDSVKLHSRFFGLMFKCLNSGPCWFPFTISLLFPPDVPWIQCAPGQNLKIKK